MAHCPKHSLATHQTPPWDLIAIFTHLFAIYVSQSFASSDGLAVHLSKSLRRFFLPLNSFYSLSPFSLHTSAFLFLNDIRMKLSLYLTFSWRSYRMHKEMDGPLQGNLKEFNSLFCTRLCHLATVMYPTYKLLPINIYCISDFYCC